MRSWQRAGAVLVGLVMMVAMVTGGSASAATRTRLVLRVDGCASCTVNLARAFSGTGIYWRSAKKRVGRDHKVVFHVPTKRTRGMSFEVAVPWEDYTGRVLNVVTRYPRQHAGQAWTARQAKRSKRAFGCWAGTQRAHARLHFHVGRFTFDGSDFGGSTRSVGAVAWASPGVRALPPKVRAWHGSIGNQEIFYCS